MCSASPAGANWRATAWPVRGPGRGWCRRGPPHHRSKLATSQGPIIAATDYVRAVPESIRAFMPEGRKYVTLGTDGFGRSDTRAALRGFFGVDAASIVRAALHALQGFLAHQPALHAPPAWPRPATRCPACGKPRAHSRARCGPTGPACRPLRGPGSPWRSGAERPARGRSGGRARRAVFGRRLGLPIGLGIGTRVRGESGAAPGADGTKSTTSWGVSSSTCSLPAAPALLQQGGQIELTEALVKLLSGQRPRIGSNKSWKPRGGDASSRRGIVPGAARPMSSCKRTIPGKATLKIYESRSD
jgi:hypothetical protein